MTKTLVVGLGSIGTRHARILSELNCAVSVVSRRPVEGYDCYSDLDDALRRFAPDYVVIANETTAHMDTLQHLAKSGYDGMVLLEKPLAGQPGKLPEHRFRRAAVAYNLRFHPVLAALHKALVGEVIIAAQVYCGQYLPDWRPGTDCRSSYSAKRELGGGVLRDLSHEIDYMMWLFGSWRRLTALGGHFSSLEIDSDDAYSLLMETERCPIVSIHLNYLDRTPRREILVHTREHTVHVDLINGVFDVDGAQERVTVERDATYRAEHQAMLGGGAGGLCSLSEAMDTLITIDAAERAASSHTWIQR